MPDSPTLSGLGAIGEDRLLDGRLILNQPRKGHRAGSDAILLAAALPELGSGPLLDVGAGVGTIGLAAGIMQPALGIVLVERDPELAALARLNATANGLDARTQVIAADIEAPAAILTAAGLQPASFACVAMNPPFYAAGETRVSPVPNRRAAHVVDGLLENWFKAARRLLKPGGSIAIIHRAEALPQILAGLATGFGGVVVRPVHALPDRPAIRVVVTATLNSKKPAALLPALILNRAEGGMTEISEALHRGQARLDMSAG
jgi:tRNA1(Val) A37 N6-methylase TrmN6